MQVAKTLDDLNLVLSSGALVMGFTLLYKYSNLGKRLEVLSAYGRMALTNYIIQGVIGSILFSPWAFGFVFGNVGLFCLLLLGLIIYIIQGIISKHWLNYYLYGPLEWFWRSTTYLKIQPFKKNKSTKD